jgi:hypothetical protein
VLGIIYTLLFYFAGKDNYNPFEEKVNKDIASLLANIEIDRPRNMRLGRWSSVAMIERYTRSVRFEDSLKLYTSIIT